MNSHTKLLVPAYSLQEIKCFTFDILSVTTQIASYLFDKETVSRSPLSDYYKGQAWYAAVEPDLGVMACQLGTFVSLSEYKYGSL